MVQAGCSLEFSIMSIVKKYLKEYIGQGVFIKCLTKVQ